MSLPVCRTPGPEVPEGLCEWLRQEAERLEREPGDVDDALVALEEIARRGTFAAQPTSAAGITRRTQVASGGAPTPPTGQGGTWRR